MTKILSRLVFTLCIVGAPAMMIGCSEGEKPATTSPTGSTEAPATPPADAAATPAATPPAEAPK